MDSAVELLLACGVERKRRDPYTDIRYPSRVWADYVFLFVLARVSDPLECCLVSISPAYPSRYMNDPEKLEQSRQMILENPMMKQMMGSMPGFEDILNDPEKWRETMQAAGEMYKNMADGGGLAGMMGGAGGMPGMEDLMGGAGTLGSTDALDELSEDD